MFQNYILYITDFLINFIKDVSPSFEPPLQWQLITQRKVYFFYFLAVTVPFFVDMFVHKSLSNLIFKLPTEKPNNLE